MPMLPYKYPAKGLSCDFLFITVDLKGVYI